MLSEIIREEFTRTPLTKLAALVALPVLKRSSAVDPAATTARLLGLRGLVFKATARPTPIAFERALAGV
jgi:glycerol-3-phosphate acyltransferase PlsX